MTAGSRKACVVKGRGGNRGAALMLALAAIVVVSVVGMALTMLILGGMRAARAASSRDELLNAAESGAEVAISRLAAGTWKEAKDSGARMVKVPGGECRVSVVPTGNARWQITSRTSIECPRGKARTCAVHLVVARVAGRRLCVVDWRIVSGEGE